MDSSKDEVKTPRQQLLEEAIKITTSDRNKSYGNPEDNFKNIAKFWTAYLYMTYPEAKINILASDVAHMMILMKVARLATNHGHRDSLVDIAGYAACGADIQERTAYQKTRDNLINKPHREVEGVTFPSPIGSTLSELNIKLEHYRQMQNSPQFKDIDPL